jgi:hypothetical protein
MDNTIEQQVKQESVALVTQAQTFTITDVVTYQKVADFRATLKGMIKKAGDFIDPIVDSAYKTWKEAKAKQAELVDPLNSALKLCNGKLAEYTTEQERIQREAQRKADEEARKKQEALDKKAKEALKKGDEAKATELLEKSEAVQAPVIQREVPKTTSALKYRDVPRFVVEQPELVPAEFTKPDEVKIGSRVRETKGTVKIAGVRIWIEKITC